jgi:hypothetical protein
LVTFADVAVPVAEAYAPSKGDVVSAPLIAKATAEALHMVPENVTVIVIDPAEGLTAHHVLM